MGPVKLPFVGSRYGPKHMRRCRDVPVLGPRRTPRRPSVTPTNMSGHGGVTAQRARRSEVSASLFRQRCGTTSAPPWRRNCKEPFRKGKKRRACPRPSGRAYERKAIEWLDTKFNHFFYVNLACKRSARSSGVIRTDHYTYA